MLWPCGGRHAGSAFSDVSRRRRRSKTVRMLHSSAVYPCSSPLATVGTAGGGCFPRRRHRHLACGVGQPKVLAMWLPQAVSQIPTPNRLPTARGDATTALCVGQFGWVTAATNPCVGLLQALGTRQLERHASAPRKALALPQTPARAPTHIGTFNLRTGTTKKLEMTPSSGCLRRGRNDGYSSWRPPWVTLQRSRREPAPPFEVNHDQPATRYLPCPDAGLRGPAGPHPAGRGRRRQ